MQGQSDGWLDSHGGERAKVFHKTRDDLHKMWLMTRKDPDTTDGSVSLDTYLPAIKIFRFPSFLVHKPGNPDVYTHTVQLNLSQERNPLFRKVAIR